MYGGPRWAVFEPNGERSWASPRRVVRDFRYGEWRYGALSGSAADDACFVRCDRSTTARNDLDNGRLICRIGVACLEPAELVVLQFTYTVRNL